MTRKFIQAQNGFGQFNEDTGTVDQELVKAGLDLNKSFVPPDVLKEAIPLFEGARTYVDHVSIFANRSIRDMSGWVTGVRYDEQIGKLVGTRHFTDNQAGRDMKSMALSIVEGRTPEGLYGASYDMWVDGDFKDPEAGIETGGQPYFHVSKIVSVTSVDDVDRPAAGGGWRQRNCRLGESIRRHHATWRL